MTTVRLELAVPVEQLRELVAGLIEQELELRNSGRSGTWATLEEAAVHVRATPAALRKRAQRGTLAGAIKDEGRWIVDLRELDASLRAKIEPHNAKSGASAAPTAPPPTQEV